ncbi:MAG TPA: hypothetical protein VD794_12905 [Flavisolibacter sp.]|nr:hypothetical protein [Flavisolibacter sp.]
MEYKKILQAFINIRPFPEYLEISLERMFKVIKEGGDNYSYPRVKINPYGEETFFNIPVKFREHLIGWRVVSAMPYDSPDYYNSVYSKQTKLKRIYIVSEDFDETEALKYEKHRSNR